MFCDIYTGIFRFSRQSFSIFSRPLECRIILQVLAIGGVINLVAKMGGAKAIAEALAKRAKSAKGTQLITWFWGF